MSNPSPDEIRADIERTRANLSANVNTLTEEVKPSTVAKRQVDKVKGNVAGLAERVMGKASDVQGAVTDKVSDLQSSASDSASNAGGTLSAAPGAAVDKAKDWGGAIADSARTAGRYIADRASSLGSGASSAASSAASGAGEWLSDAGDTARGYGRSAMKSARSFAGYDRGPSAGSVVGVTAGVIGALALGAGLMFLMDPSQGRRRRALIRDKAGRYTRETAQYAQSTGRYIAGKARGMAHEVSDAAKNVASKVTGGPAKTGEALAEMVRTEIGSLGADFKGVGFAADGNRIIVTGNLPGSRVDQLLAKIRGVAGVEGIDNQLNVQSTVL